MKKRKFLLISLFVLTTIISCGSSSGSNNTNISSVEEANKYISGKTFIGTPLGDLWYKLEFSGGRASLWSAMPQSGSWGEKKLSSVFYEIEERRYSDTGQLYYYVMLGDTDKPLTYFKFDITGKRLYLAYATYGDEGTLMKEGNRNPW